MELSICIPIYNSDVNQLVLKLQEQLEQTGIDYEINLLDDDSEDSFKLKNKALLNHSESIRYKELEFNVGRSKIRNLLSKNASGDYLLFLDSDVTIQNPNYINNYLSIIESNEIILACGGYQYPKDLKQEGKELRYIYGKHVEEIQQSNNQPQSPFLGGNFIVHKSVFESIQFDETIEQYGFEDLLFSLEYEAHFNKESGTVFNPVQISSIDINEDYLLKTKEAMENLANLIDQKKILPKHNLRILLAYNQLKSNGLLSAVTSISRTSMPLLLFNLTSKSPKLKLFQLYKLIHFSESMKEINSSKS